jgi:oligopeptide/dipeptide ABC transporter ATP-binding protein
MSCVNLLETRSLRKHFKVPSGETGKKTLLYAVDGVDIRVAEGNTLGMVGESGCGKSTVGKLILGLLKPTAGQIFFDGQEMGRGGGRRDKTLARQIQIIFQDPYSSLNPRMSVGNILSEPLGIHGLARGKEARERVDTLLTRVGLKPEDRWRYPHEFSGGQRQRVGIARALALRPRLIVADEPVSSLDVSIQAQILNLLMDLKGEMGMSYLFISHDLAVIRHISDRVAVMYLGRIVEEADVGDLFQNFIHPYTEALLNSVPTIDPEDRRRKIILEGDIPSPVNPPAGCHFHPRCPVRGEDCDRVYPEFLEKRPGHFAACHYRR